MKEGKLLRKLKKLYIKRKFPVKWYLQDSTFSFEIHHHDGLIFIGDDPVFHSDTYYWNSQLEEIFDKIKEMRAYFKKCDFLRCVGNSMNKDLPKRAIVVLKSFGEGGEINVEFQGKTFVDDIAMYEPFPHMPHVKTSTEKFEELRKKYPKLKTEPKEKILEAPIVHIQKEDI